MKKIPKSEGEWFKCLTPEQYKILREKCTDPAFTGALLHNKEKGMYVCAGCNAELFSSETKFDSGTGWPSFFDVNNSKNILLRNDSSHGMQRIEARCARCGGHLGHIFDDGPSPTRKRYCINSCALEFRKKK